MVYHQMPVIEVGSVALVEFHTAVEFRIVAVAEPVADRTVDTDRRFHKVMAVA